MLHPEPFEPSNVFTVSQLNSQIKRLLETSYRFVWVKGEISNSACRHPGTVISR
jgi:exonuclease VII large subunit